MCGYFLGGVVGDVFVGVVFVGIDVVNVIVVGVVVGLPYVVCCCCISGYVGVGGVFGFVVCLLLLALELL